DTQAQKKGALLRVPWGSRLGPPGARALFRPFRPGREGELWLGALVQTCNLHRLQMIRQHLGQLGRRQPAEPAIGAQAQLRQVLARRCDALLEARHAMDRAEIDARAPGLELFERREKSIVAAIEHWNVHPIDPPS